MAPIWWHWAVLEVGDICKTAVAVTLGSGSAHLLQWHDCAAQHKHRWEERCCDQLRWCPIHCLEAPSDSTAHAQKCLWCAGERTYDNCRGRKGSYRSDWGFLFLSIALSLFLPFPRIGERELIRRCLLGLACSPLVELALQLGEPQCFETWDPGLLLYSRRMQTIYWITTKFLCLPQIRIFLKHFPPCWPREILNCLFGWMQNTYIWSILTYGNHVT